MNEDLIDIKYSPIRQYNYARLFESVKYNGETLTEEGRTELVKNIDEAISQHSAGLPIIQEVLENCHDQHDEYNIAENTVTSVILFITLTMADCLVASKYFILADTDYDRRFMIGYHIEYEGIPLRCQHNCIANIRAQKLALLWQ